MLEEYIKSSYIMFNNELCYSESSKLMNEVSKNNHVTIIDLENITSDKLSEIITKNKENKFIIVANNYIDEFIRDNHEILSKIEEEKILVVSGIHSSEFDNKDIVEFSATKIAVGLSRNIIVLKNKKTPQKQQIIDEFINSGKEIFVYPELIGSEYNLNNVLLKHGCILVESFKDIVKNI